MKPRLIRFDETTEAAVEAHREETGETFNAYVVNAVLKRLPKDIRAGLPRPKKAGRPPNPKPKDTQ